MKKNLRILFSIVLLIMFAQLPSKSIENVGAAYSADLNYIEKQNNPQKIQPVIVSKKNKDVNSTKLEQIDDRLPENSSEDIEVETPLSKEILKATVSEERPLYKKLVEKNIIRTDIPSYLLSDELTFNPEKGPVSKVQIFGAYNGNVSALWNNGDYDTTYTTNFVQVGAMGRFRNTNTDFKVLFNPKGVHGRSYLQNLVADAYIVNNSIPHHQVIIGYSRNQIGKEGGSSSYILPFIMRSQIARNFGSTRALGVRLVGNYDLIDYNLAFNSSDRYFQKWFAGPEFTGWVDIKPFGKTDGKYGNLVIGGGLNTGKNHTHYTVGSVYVGYKYKKLWTRFEYGIADGYNGSYVVNKKAEGFYGIVGYKITPKLQIIARYDQFNPDRNVSHDTRREYTAGINYFIKGQALKLILNYVFCQNGNAPNSHRIMVGTQILL